jgi:hypothetical protein
MKTQKITIAGIVKIKMGVHFADTKAFYISRGVVGVVDDSSKKEYQEC